MQEVSMTQENEVKADEITEEAAEEVIEETESSEIPPVTFESFIFNLYNVALINFGFRDPESGKIIRNLPMAKHTIDTMGMLEEKTKGNLTITESNLLENLLYELRMSYLRSLKLAESEPKEQAPPQASSEEEKQES
jgi:hypothetical protein